MSTPTETAETPAAGNPQPEPTTPPTAEPPAEAPESEDAPLGPAGEKALEEWKKRAKEAERLSKEQTARLKEYEDAQKSESERLAERATAAEERATKATRLAVASKVEALAAATFQDPEDAVGALDPSAFVDSDGVIDTDGIKQALAGLLERKPHWARETGPRTPRPDPGQGARPTGTPTLAQQIAEAESNGDIRLSLALKSQQLREIQNQK